MPRKQQAPAQRIADVLTSVEEKREETSLAMTAHYEASCRWLEEAIESCKRKILEGTVDQDYANKKIKTGIPLQENSDPNSVNRSRKDDIPGKNDVVIKQENPVVNENEAKSRDVDVMSLKVGDLRKELRRRGLDATGLKKDLQKRLMEAVSATMSEDKENPTTVSVEKIEKVDKITDSAQSAPIEPIVVDVDMEDVAADVDSAPGRVSLMDVEQEACIETKPPAEMQVVGSSGDPVSTSKLRQAEVQNTAAVLPSITGINKSAEKSGDASAEQKTVAQDHLKTTETAVALVKQSLKPQQERQVAPVASATKSQTSAAKSGSTSENRKKAIAKTLQKATAAVVSSDSTDTESLLAAFAVSQPKEEKSQSFGADSMESDGAEVHEGTSKSSTVVTSQHAVTKTSGKVNKIDSISKATAVVATPAVSGNKKVGTSSGESNTSGGSTSVSLSIKAKKKALDEARKARLAEIRGKSKPVALATSKTTPKDTASVAPTLLSTAGGSAKAKEEDKRKLLTAQIREKAVAALKKSGFEQSSQPNQQTSREVTAAALKKSGYEQSSQQNKQTSGGRNAAALKKSRFEKSSQPSKQTARQLNAAALKKSGGSQPNNHTAKGPPAVASIKPQYRKETPPAQQAQASIKKDAVMKRPEVLSPMDTYEISDREESDSEDESDYEDDGKLKKKIPKWAQKSNLIPALERQYAGGQARFDPDLIFPEVQTCDLQAIFDKKKERYQRRTSSGNWTKDRVTVAEKLTYKRTMGYSKA